MTNEVVRTAHLKDTAALYTGIAAGELPAVSYVKPSGLVDGHPASSKLILFEGFVKKIVDAVKPTRSWRPIPPSSSPFDEGGGYWDSGYVQPLDFFGDGTRIPLIVVSPYSKGGHISHYYTDHVSISKFIERNWGLHTITTAAATICPTRWSRRILTCRSIPRRLAIYGICSPSPRAKRLKGTSVRESGPTLFRRVMTSRTAQFTGLFG